MKNTDKPRARILQEAKHVLGEREHEYGNASRSTQYIADMWSTYLDGKHGTVLSLSGEDVAHMMLLMKIVRTYPHTPAHTDNYCDMIGYAAIAYECALNERGDDE